MKICHSIFTTVILALLTNLAFGQNDTSPLIKAGGFVYFLHGNYNGFSVHLEYERAFKHAPFLTSGPRLDYTNFEYSLGDLMLAYDLKLYPFYGARKKSYHGLFMGIDITYLVKSQHVDKARYGPGIGSLFGYQYLFKDKVSLCLEGSMIYLQDLNENAPQHNPANRYLYVFACIKAGVKIHRATPPASNLPGR